VGKPVVFFPDAVLVAIQYLRGALGVPAYSQVPEVLPVEFIRVERLGGMRNTLVTDRPRIDIECWSDSEEDAEALMSRARAYALAMAGKRGDTTVYNVAEVTGPQYLPHAESGKARYVFAVEFSTRALAM
jgi:hypothetical protein